MRLIARCIPGLAAALFLALPSGAAATHQADHPTGDYVWSTDDCSSGTRRAPVTVVFRGFGTELAATQAITAEMPAWGSQPASPAQHLYMDNNSSGVASCHEQLAQARVSPEVNSRRTLMRLWSSGYVTAATPVRQQVTTASSCGASVTNPGWVTAPGGYDLGRDSFEGSFQGANPTYGPYPLTEVDRSNTQPIQLCNGTTVSSDGNVAIVRPKDDLGYQDPWPTPAFTSGSPDLVARAQQGGVTVARYSVSWGTVGSNDGLPGSCGRAPGRWNSALAAYDDVYFDLTGSHACTEEPLKAGAIRPLIFAAGAPPQYADWRCDDVSDQNCTGVVGTCTGATSPNSNVVRDARTVNSAAANTGWQDFVRNIADRYPRAKGIEIRNEPNLPNFWGGCDPQPGRYASLLRFGNAGVEAAHTLDHPTLPKVPVLLAGMSPQEDPQDPGVPWRSYLEDVYTTANASGTPFADQFDSMGLHPYRSREDRDSDGPNDPSQSFTEAAQTDVSLARTFLANHGAAGTGVWVTEVGVSTGVGVNSPKHVSGESQQATVLQNIYQGLRNESSVRVVVLYRFVDSGDAEVEQPGYGVIRSSDGSPPFGNKIAYRCLALTRGEAGDCP